MRRGLEGLALAAALASLAAGLTELARLRYASGDVYPPLSSLRADPLGAKALHEALAELPGLSVERNRRPLARLTGGPGVTVLLLGADWGHLPRALARDLTALAHEGTRVVLTSPSVVEARRFELDRETEKPDEKEGEKESENREVAEHPELDESPKGKRNAGSGPLGALELDFQSLPSVDERPRPVPVRRAAEAPATLPAQLA